MNSSIPPSNRGLPILKLLFLIVLFAVVVGLFFPAVGPTRGAHPRAQAKNDVQNIVAAVKAYYAEYGKYPDVTGDNGDPTQGDVDTIVGDPSVNALTANSALFNILRAIDREPNKGHVLNPQRIVFFQGKPVSDPKKPGSGFLDKVPEGGKNAELLGCFFDPWGRQYNVIMDTSYDNYLNLDHVYSDFAGAPPDGMRPHTGVGAWSSGSDGKIGEKGNRRYKDKKYLSDDVISWQ